MSKLKSIKYVKLNSISFSGRGFSKLYKPYLSTNGRLATTYFNFKRPKGLSLKFREIVRRTNTPFLVALKKPPGKQEFTAEVSSFYYYVFEICLFLIYTAFKELGNKGANGFLS